MPSIDPMAARILPVLNAGEEKRQSTPGALNLPPRVPMPAASEGDRLVREAILIAKAVEVARTAAPPGVTLGAVDAGAPLRNLIQMRTNESLRKTQRLYINDLILSDPAVVFGDPPDAFREMFSAFCYAMFRGFGTRYIDRHQAEDGDEFLDRPGKHALNITALVINILSKLYAEAPTREAGPSTPEAHRAALQAMWASPLWSLSLLEVDRLTRLLGTVAVRPFYDPTVPGKIRLWAFLNHQLRIVPRVDRPWEPAAVIERVQPFRSGEVMAIWTDRWFVTIDMTKGSTDNAAAEPHGLGRIPHVFFRDGLSYTSFFHSGRGRDLCTPNAHINNRLTDLHEVEALQGFSVAEIVNSEHETPTISPRSAFHFKARGGPDQPPFGINFKNPGAPLKDLRASIDADIRDVLKANRIPDAAIGAAINQRSISGAAIRAAMQPLIDDLDERAKLFAPLETDLADSALRVLAEHDPAFRGAFEPAALPPEVKVVYSKPSLPMETAEAVKRDEFDTAHGVRSPVDLLHERHPDLTREEAAARVKRNLDEARALAPAVSTEPTSTPADEAADEAASMLDQLEDHRADLDAMGRDVREVQRATEPTPGRPAAR